MSKLVNATRSYDSVTNNGAVTHSTSLNNCVDLFFVAGASRNMVDSQITAMFERAYAQDKNIAAKILFWARDARQGAGERRFFQVIMTHILAHYPEVHERLLKFTPEFGYWKDVLATARPDHKTLEWMASELSSGKISLLAKWFPRKGPWFVRMHNHLEISPKELRQRLVAMTKVVETQMCNQKWGEIKYEHVPSIAMHKYRKAFFKHDLARMTTFIEAVHKGEAKINAGVLFPHQLYDAVKRGENAKAVEAQWINLPDYMKDCTERILPICDVSGSMQGLPMSVSVSLGIYISERNKGLFKDAFMTFSTTPEMLYLKGSLAQRMRQLETSHWSMSTNLQATFELILNSALRENLSEEEMPTKLLIISDMEFNEADRGRTNLDSIRSKYQASGYTMPEIVFWNVNGRMGNSPARVADKGVGLVSGFSPSILKSILGGKIYGPEQLMLDTVMVDRYKDIQVD